MFGLDFSRFYRVKKQQPIRSKRKMERNVQLKVEQLEDRLVPAPFTAGDIVVVQVGVGNPSGGAWTGASTTAPGDNGTAVFLDEYTPTGTFVQQIAMPTTTSGSQSAFTLGNNSSEGLLNLSTDGQQLLLAGYDSTVGGTSGGVDNGSEARVVGVAFANGTVDTSTVLTAGDQLMGANVREAAGSVANGFYVDGQSKGLAGSTQTAAAGGVAFVPFGGSTGTDLVGAGANYNGQTLVNGRGVQIANGQVYMVQNKDTAEPIILSLDGTTAGSLQEPTNAFNAGSNPTSAQPLPGTGSNLLIGSNTQALSSAPKTGNFFMAKVGASADFTVNGADSGFNTLYVADDGGTLQKYSWNSGTSAWTSDGTIGSGSLSFEGLAGSVNGTTVTFFATQITPTTGNTVVTIVDNTGFGGSITGITPTALAGTTIPTADAGVVYRGIAFVPQPGAAVNTTTDTPTFTPTGTNPYGTSESFTAVVHAASGSAAPTAGTVTFLNGSTVLATATTETPSGTAATFTVSSTTVPVGSYSNITAVYSPGAGFNTSTSSASAVTLTITGTGTTAAVPTFAPTTAFFGQSVAFTDVVTASSGSTAPPAGTVTFMNGSTVLATATTETPSGTAATFTVSSATVPVGAYSTITAVYTPGAGFTGSTSSASAVTLTINNNATTTAAPTFTPSSVTVGQAVNFTAVVTDTSTSTAPAAGTVTFMNGSTVLATATTETTSGAAATFTVSTTSVPVGNYSNITAVYAPGAGFSGSTSSASGTTLSVSAVQIPIGTLAQWTFENDPIANNNNPAPSTGVGTASAIGMTNSFNSTTSTNTDDVVQGATGDTGSNGLADLSQIWRVRGQTPGNGWSSQAPIGTQGAVFATSTVGFAGPINVSFDWYATTQGEANLQLEYTTNGTTWINVPINVPAADADITAKTNSTSPNTVTGSYVQISGQQWAKGLTATISDPAAANNPNFAIELVNASTGADDIAAAGTPLNNTSGNWRFDNVDIAAPQAYTPGDLVVLQAGDGVTSYNAQAPLYLNEIGTSNAKTSLVAISGATADALGNVTATTPNFLVNSANYSTPGVSGGTATLTTTAVNGFAVGDMVTILNMNDAGYDGTYAITSVDSTGMIFTYLDTNATAPAGFSFGGTASVQNFSVGQTVQISGVQVGADINSGYNGVYTIASVNNAGNTFTYFSPLAAGLAAGTPAPNVSGATGGAFAYALVQQDSIPSVAGSGAQAGNQPITIDLSAAAGNGQLNRSYDGSVLTFDGIDSTVNNGGLSGSATPTGQDNRDIAVIGGNPGVALSSGTSNTANNNPTVTPFYNSTTQGAFYVGDDNRGSIADSPTGPIYSAGHPNQAGGAVSQGVHDFSTEGPAIGTQVSASTNIRGITIGFDNREYFSTASGAGGATILNTAGIFTDAQALPTSNPVNDIQVVPALFGASKLGGVFFADVNGDGIVDNGDKLYFVDDGTVGGTGTGGIYVSTWNNSITNNAWNTPNNVAAAAAGFVDHWSVPVKIGDAPVQNGAGGVGQLRGLTGTVLGNGTVDLYTTAYDGSATTASSDNSIIQQWVDPNSGFAITNATITSGTTVQITTLGNPNWVSGVTQVQIDGVVTTTATSNGLGLPALTGGYNGIWTVTGSGNTWTYTDTNTGASSLTPITNTGAAQAIISGTIIAEANAGTASVGSKDFGDVGLRGVAFAPVAATNVVLSQSPANPLTPGTGVNLTAMLSNPETGVNLNGDVVTFINENTNTVLGQAIVGASVSNEAILNLPTGVVGDVFVHAYFAGGGTQALASARSNTIQVIEAGDVDSSTQLVTSCPVGAGIGSPVTFTATVTHPATPALGANDTISFYNGAVSSANLLGTSLVNTGTGVATLVSAFGTIGTDNITAVFNGDNNYESSQSSLIQNIGANASGTISSSANNVALNATPTYTAKVVGNATVGAPGGTVTFSLVSATTGAVVGTSSATALTISGTTGTATWTSPALASPGSYFVTFTYTPGTGIQYNGFTIDTVSATNGTAFVETVKQGFTPGNLVAVQRGDGNINLGSSGYLVFLDEYTTAGTLVQRVALPNLDAGTTHALLLSGQNGGEGLLNRSANGAFLTVAGYDVPVGHTFLTSTFPYQFPRTIALIDGTANVNTTTAIGVANPTGSGVPASIKSATATATGTGQTVTITLTSSNFFMAGQSVTIAGITDGVSGTAYDGTFTITTASGTTFSYVDSNNITSTTPTVASATASSPASVPYNPSDVVSVDGTQFYLGSNLPVGDTIDGGILYVGSVGATTATQIGPVGTSSSSIGIAGGQLYSTSGSGKVTAVGSGLPTTIGQSLTGLPSFAQNYDLFFHHQENAEEVLLLNTNDGSTINPNVAYVADQANGLLKFTLFSAANVSLSDPGSGVVTATYTGSALVPGEFVNIANASDPTFDGTFVVATAGAGTFTFNRGGTTAGSATGATATEWVYGDSSGTGTFGQKLIFAGGATAVTGFVMNPGPSAQVQLYMTGVNVQQQNPNQLDSWLDTNGGTAGFTSGNVTNLAFVGGTPTGNPAGPNGNENFAGLAFAPGFATNTVVAVTGNATSGYSVTATVTDPTGGANVPTGAVYLYLDGSTTPFRSALLNGSGIATFSITGGALTGEHSFTAVYQGDVKDDQSTGVSGQAFGAGNLIATVSAGGTAGNGTAASVSEFHTTGGAALQTISLPTSGAGELTLKANTPTEGYISDSADGHSASFGGYLVDAGSTTSGANAAIAQIGANGSINTSTQIANADISGSVHATISADGLGFWVAGANYLRYVPFANSAATPSTLVSNYYPGASTVEIADGNGQTSTAGLSGQLYITGAAGSPGGGLSSIDGPAQVLGGLATVAGQAEQTLGNGGGTDFNTAKDASGNFPVTNQIAVSPDGLNIFVADSRTDGSGGILWYADTLGNGSWTLLGSAQAGTGADSGLQGLVADFSQVVSGTGPVTFYATTSASSGNRIVKITGFNLVAGGGSSFTAPTFTTVETAAAGTAFNGVAFTPTAPGATATTTVAAVTGTPGVYPDGVTLSATVTGGTTPTGYVSFQTSAGVEIGSAPLVSGTATLMPQSDFQVLESGTIKAVYTGDATHASSNGSTSATATLGAATTTLTPQFSNVATGVTDNLTAQVTYSGSNAEPTGTVTFWQDAVGTGTKLGTVNLTPTIVNVLGTPTLEFLASGVSVKFTNTTGSPHPMFAVYSGDSNFATDTSASAPIAVVLSPTVAVTTNNANPGNSGASVTETVTVTGTGATPTGFVQLYDNLVPIGSPVALSGGTTSVNLTTSATQGVDGNGNQFLLPGTQSITAIYSGDANYFSGSGVNQQAVQSNAFGAGDKFVYRVGDGINSLDAPTGSTVAGSIGSTIYIDEINTTTGNVVQSIILPSNDGTGAQASIHAIVGNGQQSTTEQLSVDGANSAIWLTGYDTNPLLGATVSNTGVVSGQGTLAPGIPTVSGSITRAVGRITTAGVVQDVTMSKANSGSSFGNFNAVYSPDGNSFYASGDGAVVFFSAFTPASGTTPVTPVFMTSPTGTTTALEPDGGNLAIVGAPGFGNDGPQVYAGFPTTAQSVSNLPGFSDAAATAGGQASTFYVDVYFTHLDNTAGPGGTSTAPAGINTMYLSDDGPSFAQGAITKWSLVGGVWTVTDHIVANGTAPNPVTYYYISGQTLSEGPGSSAVGNVTLDVTYGNGGNADTGPGQLFSITDNSGYNAVGLTAGAVIHQTSAASKEVYRGVAAFGTTDLTGSATAVTATEGTAATNVQVATFTDPDDTTAAEATSNFTVTINWGDGTTSAGTVTAGTPGAGGTTYTVTGTHTYAEDSAVGTPYPVKVTINDQSWPANLILSTTATVADATASFNDITVTGVAPTGLLEETSFTSQVATFTDPIDFGGAPDAASSYTATIQWGDGTSSAGTITLTNPTAAWPASGIYSVSGTHTYAEDTAPGFAYPISVTVSSTGPDDHNAVGTTTATVADSGGPNDITGTGSSLSETAGTAFGPVQVGQFTDQLTYGGTVDPVGTYSASINWGDGTAASTGTITFDHSNTAPGTAWFEVYDVAGSHTYASSSGSPYTITVTILGDDAGTPATVTASATVASSGTPITVSSININAGTDPIISASNPSTGLLSFTTDGSNNFAVGDKVLIAGINATYNGSWVVNTVGTNTFTVLDGSVTGQATVTNSGTATDVTVGDTGELVNGVAGGGHSASFNSQRSMVDSIVYTFNQPVNLAGAGSANGAAFTITATGANPGTVPTWTYSSPDNGTNWVVTFSGLGVSGNSIANGEYQIVLNAASVSAVSGGGTLASNDTEKFYRLYGDTVGNGHDRVNTTDNLVFQNAFNTRSTSAAFLAYLDVNDDGRINATDNLAFTNDFNVRFAGFTATI